MKFESAFFELAAGTSEQLPDSDMPEIVFAGHSNVGKSSLINKLLNRRSLARVSSQPGKTATINFYNLSMAATSNNTTLDVGDNTSAEGSLTVNGTTYEVSSVYMKTTVTSQKLTISEMSIYFGDNGKFAMNLTFAGNGVTQE